MNYKRNYGGILQCVALSNVLERMGHEVEVIRYSAKDRDSIKRKLRLLFSGLPNDVLGRYVYDIVMDVFNRLSGKRPHLSARLLEKCKAFIDENINYTEVCDENTIGGLISHHELDAVIIGSDKIWGELGRERLVYMGDWTPRFEGKIISYAACSSFPLIPSYNKAKIHTLLSRFSAVSVRDAYTRNLFKCYPDVDMKVVLDPTFLWDFEPFLERSNSEPYIFTYILGREISGGHKGMIEKIREKYGPIKVKAIVLSDESLDIAPYADEVIDDADPKEWLNAIYNASFVYTDSFHGIAFSMKFRKPFLAYYTETSRATRLIDLRDKLHLDRYIISTTDECMERKSLDQIPDYHSIYEMLDEMKTDSVSFLENSILK